MESIGGAAAQQLIDGAPDGIIVVDGDGRITTVNSRLTEMLGYTNEELLGQPIEKLVPTSVHSVHRSHRSRYAAAPTRRQMGETGSRLTARCADGSLHPVEIALSPIVVDGTTATMAIVRDSAKRVAWELDREAVEREIQKSEARFRSAFDDASVPMAIVDLAEPEIRTVLLANDALADLLGFEIEDLIGASFAELTHPDDRRRDALGAAAMLRGVASYHAEKRLRTADGSYVWTRVDASTIEGIDGAAQTLAHIIDISRRVDAERERDRRERLLSDLGSIRKAALDESSIEEILQLVVDAARVAADVDHCFIASPNLNHELVCVVAASDQSLRWVGQKIADENAVMEAYRGVGPRAVAEAMSDAELFVAEPTMPTLGPSRVMPMRTSTTIEGVLFAARLPGRPAINAADEARLDALAAEAAVALLLDNARHNLRQMLLVEDRERIARDLHDVVIQRLFATGMSLQASLGASGVPADRAEKAITDLDEVIAVIRGTIFQLTRTDDSLAAEIERIADRQRALGRSMLELSLDGPLDAVVPTVRNHLVPALNELLSNVERHANADHTSVQLQISDDEIQLVVVDDGDGFAPTDRHGFGLRNLKDRAEALGGTVRVTSPTDSESLPPRGTKIEWIVPLQG